MRNLASEAAQGKRLTAEEGLSIYERMDLLELGEAARRTSIGFHGDGPATFLIDRNINYTNVCRNRCAFCAFFRDADSPEAFLLTDGEIYSKVSEAVGLGATQVMLQGGLHPEVGIDFFLDVFSGIKSRFDVVIHSLSPPEIVHLSEMAGMTVPDTLALLRSAGLSSLPGGGAEILVDSVRARISPMKIKAGQWLRVMQDAHDLGMKTTATMMFGAGESRMDRLRHMESLRDLQDRTRGFISFIPWTFQPGNTKIGGEGTSSLEYLRTLAVARLFLDNFTNIQGSWVTQGPEIGQLSLEFGANDLGSIMIEENVVRAAGVAHRLTRDEMVRLILSMGRRCAQRDTYFRIIRRFDGGGDHTGMETAPLKGPSSAAAPDVIL